MLDDEHLLDGGVPAMAAADGGRLLQRKDHRLAAVVCDLKKKNCSALDWQVWPFLCEELSFK